MRGLLRIGVVLIGILAIDGFSAACCAAADGQKAAGQSSPVRPTLRFQFHAQPWKDVIEWFAKQADLSLIMEAAPPGSFSYSDNREYTPAEAIDLINTVLATKGYTLVRRDRMLMLINLEDGIPPNLVPTVSAESLNDKGEYELVRVLFDLDKFKPDEAEAEVKKMLGPQGSVTALPKSRRLSVTDTAGRLRAIRAMIDRVEKPEGSAAAGFRTVQLKYVRADDVMPILRQLLDIPEDKMAAADGSLRIAVEPRNDRLMFLTGQPEKVGRVVDIVQELDVPLRGRVRTFPMSPESARAAVDRIEAVWPTLRANKLRVVAPPAAAPALPPDTTKPPLEVAARKPIETAESPGSRGRQAGERCAAPPRRECPRYFRGCPRNGNGHARRQGVFRRRPVRPEIRGQRAEIRSPTSDL